jgi:hypothetical protein
MRSRCINVEHTDHTFVSEGDAWLDPHFARLWSLFKAEKTTWRKSVTGRDKHIGTGQS